MTEEDLDRIKPLILSGKVILIRRPPWWCANGCGDTVKTFRVVERPNESVIEAECEKCGEKVYACL